MRALWRSHSSNLQKRGIGDLVERLVLNAKSNLADLDIPVAFGFPAGHGEKNYPLLMGAVAELNVGAENYVLTCGAK